MESDEHTFRRVVELSIAPDAKDAPLDSTMVGLGLDSLDLVEFVMDLEEEFGVAITDEQAENAKTLGDLFALVATPEGDKDDE